MRELPKRQYNTVSKMLDLWEKGGELDVETAKMLRDGIASMPFDWQKAARCLLAVALCCIFVGIAALTRARWGIDLMLWLFGGKAIVKCIFFAVVAAALYLWSGKRRRKFPEKVFTNEAMLFLGVLSTAASIAWLGKALDNGSGGMSEELSQDGCHPVLSGYLRMEPLVVEGINRALGVQKTWYTTVLPAK